MFLATQAPMIGFLTNIFFATLFLSLSGTGLGGERGRRRRRRGWRLCVKPKECAHEVV